ncbi:LAETG motif-containing sortase-dependent surface protein [Streptomyces afghaniensis]|uniref:LAETG motif-containing sortase-dependent surface protein n=1 Tax=Streptomyces afghaniensis TaxID=66865 RepID=UPI00277DED34|nr:LAETG motif-containing sortase-dependent surface protein [Streptomyces afghaniensis]MDQ1019185.1 LPXTG-motif cell wall-anchored protein [Streptomyces afghaniensis]
MHLRPSAAVLAAAVIAVAGPAVAAPLAQAEEGAPELIVSALPSATPKPGEVYDEPVTLTNKGTAAADGVTFRVRLTRGLDFPEQVKGCTYSTVKDQVRQALCELDTVIEPGASVTTPVRFKALDNALMEAVEYGTSATGEAPGEGYDDSYRRLTLTADNTADLVAVGEDTEALPGGEQSVTATLRNDGPGWVRNQESDDLPGLLVQIPPGTVAVGVPKDCAPFGIDGPSGPQGTTGKPKYVCWPQDGTLDAGRSLAYTFMLKIEKSAQDTEGEVKASSVYDIAPAYDKNRANNTARISIDLPSDNEPGPSPSGGADGGSGNGGNGNGGNGNGGNGNGGSGNDPEGQAAGGTGATASPSASASTGTTASGSGGTTTGATTGGDLASTGSDGTPLLAGAAAAAAVIGGGLVFVVRRRGAAGSA